MTIELRIGNIHPYTAGLRANISPPVLILIQTPLNPSSRSLDKKISRTRTQQPRSLVNTAIIFTALDQLDIAGKSYDPTTECVTLDSNLAPNISRALYALGYASACNGSIGSIAVNKPSRTLTVKKRERNEKAPMMPETTRRQPPGAPNLLTSKRTRALSLSEPTKIEQHVVSKKYMVTLIDRLSRPREFQYTEIPQEGDSPRIGFRLTVMKRSCQQQKEYMENLSVPRVVYGEPYLERVRGQPFLSSEAVADLVERLSKPHTLESLLKRYAVTSNSDNTFDDISLPDKPLHVILDEGDDSPSPYLCHLVGPFVRPFQGKESNCTDRGLQEGLESVCQAISNMVDKGEGDFPGKIDSYVTTMIENMILSTCAQHFNDETSSTMLTDNVPSTCVHTLRSFSLLDFVRLFKPSKLLLCRLNIITHNLIRYILSLHEKS